jgi:NADH-quinone oxidoreductase subunit C
MNADPAVILDEMRTALPGAAITLLTNPSPSAQHSLLIGNDSLMDVLQFLRDHLHFDLLSNLTGVDWPSGRDLWSLQSSGDLRSPQSGRDLRSLQSGEDLRSPQSSEDLQPPQSGGDLRSPQSGRDLRSLQSNEDLQPPQEPQSGFLETVYHLYSTTQRLGPLVLRARTTNRADNAEIPSVVPLFRSAEFQEREIFDLYGITFTHHPDLRRILMWDEFTDHPMRKDYTPPDDYEYEPTPHGDVLGKAKVHYPVLETQDCKTQDAREEPAG